MVPHVDSIRHETAPHVMLIDLARLNHADCGKALARRPIGIREPWRVVDEAVVGPHSLQRRALAVAELGKATGDTPQDMLPRHDANPKLALAWCHRFPSRIARWR